MKLIALHTSLNRFTEFDPAFIGSSTGWRGVVAGFFFSVNQGHSSHIAEGQDGWFEYQVEIEINNPARARNYEAAIAQWGEEDEATEKLKSLGHDGVIFDGADEIVVWNPAQIKILNVTKI